MPHTSPAELADRYRDYISDAVFPCVAAKAALARDQIRSFVATAMPCPHQDEAILSFLYDFIRDYRASDSFFSSAAVIFEAPAGGEEGFEHGLWNVLQRLSDLDATRHPWDARVSSDPLSPEFSFSIGGEAFFVVGIHPDSPREARRFSHPALVFNPHQQFERLRASGVRYQNMKNVIRKRDTEANGSFNPMLDDFGGSSEVWQYSGRQYDSSWICPLVVHHSISTQAANDDRISDAQSRHADHPAPLGHGVPAEPGPAVNDNGCPWRAGQRPDLLQSA